MGKKITFYPSKQIQTRKHMKKGEKDNDEQSK